jgi:uncharacterized protein YeaO (DUF488 family)
MVKLKRIYDEQEIGDGYRILVDRLWPRGVSKEKAKLDLWLKEIAPSGQLRQWFGHDPAKWPEFQKKFRAEIMDNAAALDKLRQIIKKEKTVTLLFAARDEKHNEAVVIRDAIRRGL